MPAFVQLVPDAFGEGFAGQSGDLKAALKTRGGNGGQLRKQLYKNVRRPLRGFQMKRDTYASIQVVKPNGEAIPLIDSGGVFGDEKGKSARSARYSNFLLQSANEARQEKYQVVLTFGEPYVFFFGEQPRIYNFAGVLMNTEDFNWRAEFWKNYDEHLRGTKCVQNRTRVILTWDTIIIQGYLLGATADENANEPNIVRFGFQLFLTSYEDVSDIGNPVFPRNDLVLNATDELDVNTNTSYKSTTLAVRDANKGSLLDTLRTGFFSAQDELSGMADQARRLGNMGTRVSTQANAQSTTIKVFGTAGTLTTMINPSNLDAFLKSGGPIGSVVGKATGLIKDRIFGVDASPRREHPAYMQTFGTFLQDNKDEYIAQQPNFPGRDRFDNDALLGVAAESEAPSLFDRACDKLKISDKTKQGLITAGKVAKAGVFVAGSLPSVFTKTVSTTGKVVGDGTLLARI